MSWGPGFWAGRWSFGAFGDVPGCRCVPREAPPRGQQGGEWDRGHRASSSRIPPAVRDLSDATGHPEPPPHPHRQPRSAPKSPQRLFFHSISLRTTAANRLTVGQAAAFQQPPHFPAPSSLAPGACVCGGGPLLPQFPPFPADFPLSCRPGGGLIIIDSMPDIRKRKPIPLVSDLVRFPP